MYKLTIYKSLCSGGTITPNLVTISAITNPSTFQMWQHKHLSMSSSINVFVKPIKMCSEFELKVVSNGTGGGV